MKRNVIVFGLILGTILCINMFYMVNLLYTHPDFKSNDILGYTAMVVMFSLIFFGVRNYRNKQLAGSISFGKAFKTGLFIALLAATFYVAIWLVTYYVFVPDYLDKYISHVLTECTPSNLDAKTKEMAEFKEMYKKPVFVVLITYFEVLPVGIIVALISAAILKTKGQKSNAVNS